MKMRTYDYDIGYPVYDAKFLDSGLLLVTGGGEGTEESTNINRLTALRVDFGKRKVVKRFRELKLDDKIDAPTVMDTENNVILLGANAGTQAIREGRNESLHQFRFHKEHLVYSNASALEPIAVPLQYQKMIKLSHDGVLAAIATSKLPTVIHILDAQSLNEKYEITTNNEVRDLDFSPDGKLLTYITQNTLELISVITGKSVMRKTDFKSSLSKVRFQDNDQVLIATNVKDQGGISVVGLSISKELSVTKSRLISKKCKDITSMDVNLKNAVIALAGSDNSVTLLKLHSLKTIKSFSNVHSLNITKVAFSPDGQFLASVSAAKTVNVIEIPNALGVETHKIYNFFVRVFQLLIFAIICGVAWLFYQYKESQQLPDISDYFTLIQRTQTTTEEPLTTVAQISETTTTSSFEPVTTSVKPRVLERKVISTSEVAHSTAESEQYEDEVEDEEDENEEEKSGESGDDEEESGESGDDEGEEDSQFVERDIPEEVLVSSTSVVTPSETSIEVVPESVDETTVEHEVLEPESSIEEDIPETSDTIEYTETTQSSVQSTPETTETVITSTESTEGAPKSKSRVGPIVLAPSSKATSSIEPVSQSTIVDTTTTAASEQTSVPGVSEFTSLTSSETVASTSKEISSSSVATKKKKKSKKSKTKKSKKSKKTTSKSSGSESASSSTEDLDLTAFTSSVIEYESMTAPNLTQSSALTTTTDEPSLDSMTTPETTSSPSFKIRTPSQKAPVVEETTVSTVESATSETSVETSSTEALPTETLFTKSTPHRAPMVLERSSTSTTSVESTTTDNTESFEDRILEALDVEEEEKEAILRGLEEIAVQAHAPEEIIEDMEKAIHKLEEQNDSSVKPIATQVAETDANETNVEAVVEGIPSSVSGAVNDTAALLDQTTTEPAAAPEPDLEQIPNTENNQETVNIVEEVITPVDSSSVAAKIPESVVPQPDEIPIVHEIATTDLTDLDDSGDEADIEEETHVPSSTAETFGETVEALKTAVDASIASTSSEAAAAAETEVIEDEEEEEEEEEGNEEEDEEESDEEESSNDGESSSEEVESTAAVSEVEATIEAVASTHSTKITTEALNVETTKDETTHTTTSMTGEQAAVPSESITLEETETISRHESTLVSTASITTTIDTVSETSTAVTEEAVGDEEESNEEESSEDESDDEEESGEEDEDEEDEDEADAEDVVHDEL